MKLNVNIFNELNGSFEKEFKTKKQVIIEGNKVTTEDLIKEAAPQPAQSGNIAPEPVVNQTTADVEVKDEVTPTEEENKEMNEKDDIHFYLITLKHDNGKVKLKTAASSKEQAIKSILKSENAPESAVVKIEDLGPVLKEEKCEKSDEKVEEKCDKANTEEKETVNEEEIIQLPNTEPEPDYIISDVTVLNQISDGDVQAPDIDGLLTLVSESLTNKYGDWGKIKVLSSNKINENSSFALVDITTKELVEEFKNRGIRDGAIGKNLIVENAKGLVEFKVNNLSGTTIFSKKSDNPASIIEEWVESEFLSEAKAEKEKEAEVTKAKNEKDTVEYYINNRLDLKMEIANIEMFVEMSKSIKDESFTKMVQDRMYGFVAELPHSLEVTNKDDKYELEFTNADNTVEMIFGKEWVKEPTEDNKVVGVIKESYEQFNIGEIEVVFNPDTYETLYSIPSADVKDKKINLTKVPTVETPYDTDTIIKSYVETKFGRIPTEEEAKEEPEEIDVTDINVDTIEEPIGTDTEDEELHEDKLPEEPDTNELQDTPDTTDEVEEVQNETGTARFVKIRPKQEANLADVRERVAENNTPESSYIVVDTKDLLPEEWEDLINNLNKTQSYLADVQSLDRKNYSFNVIKLTSSGAGYSLLVDPLGYGYPRYLAIKED